MIQLFVELQISKVGRAIFVDPQHCCGGYLGISRVRLQNYKCARTQRPPLLWRALRRPPENAAATINRFFLFCPHRVLPPRAPPGGRFWGRGSAQVRPGRYPRGCRDQDLSTRGATRYNSLLLKGDAQRHAINQQREPPHAVVSRPNPDPQVDKADKKVSPKVNMVRSSPDGFPACIATISAVP